MNEGKTTGIFALIAVVSLALAWWTNPESASDQSEMIDELVQTDVFKKFTDPADASTLQIIKYNEDLATTDRFEVARDARSKLWTLPSNDDYPADAAEQVRDATTPLIGLKILSIESNSKGDHELYGVVNPDEDNAMGASGVGMLVTLKDDKDSVLASLIIGKEVDQVEGQRYVRVPTQDAVYKVEISTDAFKTNFQDWIEAELLGVRSFDITEIGVRDYELKRQDLVTMALQRNFDADLSYDTSGSNWSLDSMQVYENGQPAPAELQANEELNNEFLNNLRTAIQDLQIVDVKRKPKGLAADLKADQSLLNDSESIKNLQNQGFYPANGPNGPEIYAAGGETIIGKDNGVKYVLRFGEPTATLGQGSDANDDSGINRYLLVTAILDESKFPQPDLEPVPETVEEMLAMENPEPNPDLPDAPLNLPLQDSSGEASTEETSETTAPETSETTGETEDKSGEETSEKPAEDDPASGESSESTSEESTETGTEAETGASESSTGDPEQGGASEEKGGDQGNPDPEALPQEAQEEQGGDVKTAESPTTENAATEPSQENSEQETAEELQERLEVLQEKIKKDNQRKIDERNEQIEEARKEVQTLNARFSDWYYVVSDSVYKKIRVNREDLIKTAEPEAEPAPKPFSSGILNPTAP